MSSGGEGACQLPFGTKIHSLSLPGYKEMGNYRNN